MRPLRSRLLPAVAIALGLCAAVPAFAADCAPPTPGRTRSDRNGLLRCLQPGRQGRARRAARRRLRPEPRRHHEPGPRHPPRTDDGRPERLPRRRLHHRLDLDRRRQGRDPQHLSRHAAGRVRRRAGERQQGRDRRLPRSPRRMRQDRRDLERRRRARPVPPDGRARPRTSPPRPTTRPRRRNPPKMAECVDDHAGAERRRRPPLVRRGAEPAASSRCSTRSSGRTRSTTPASSPTRSAPRR